MVEEKYLEWLNHPQMDEELKEELQSMTQEQKTDAFYTDAKFGTAGMRNLLGAGTNRLNVYTIRKATLGFGRHLLTQAENPTVAIAYDNRFNSQKFAQQSAKVLASLGIKSYVFESLRTTPELSYTVRYLKCSGGIMITASHNPKEYNGYKVYDSNGCQLVPELVAGVIAQIDAITEPFVEEPELTAEQEALIVTISKEVDEPYLNEVLSIQLNPDLTKDNFKIVYTPQHGTSLMAIKWLFDKVGYDCTYVEEQCTPDPAFTNTIIPNPEDPRAYVLAIEYAKKVDADIVLTTDPDGDRLGVAVKNGDEYTLMTGNQTGSVLIDYVFTQMIEKGLMPENPVMFNTVVTSDLGEIISKHYGVETEKTLTGFKYIGDKIAKYEKTHEKNFVFGYEESYGYLIKEFVRDKDANQSCLLIAEMANYYHKQGKSILDKLHELYAEYGTFLETQTSISLPGADGSEKIKALIEGLRNNPPKEIGGVEVVRREDFGTQKAYVNGAEEDIVGFDVSDVLKYFLADGTWIAVRPSGTEPKCKFYYCIKGKDQADVEAKRDVYYAAMDALTK